MKKWTGYIRFPQERPGYLREQRMLMSRMEESLKIRRIEVEVASPDDEWPVLNEILDQLVSGYGPLYYRQGLIVCSLDRMAYSMSDLSQKMDYLRENNIPLISIEGEITLFGYDSDPSIPPLVEALGRFEERIAQERAAQKHQQARLRTNEKSESLYQMNQQSEKGETEVKQLGEGSPEKVQEVSAQQESGGRPRAFSEEDIPEVQRLMRDPDASVQSICERFDVSKATLYRYVSPSGERRK